MEFLWSLCPSFLVSFCLSLSFYLRGRRELPFDMHSYTKRSFKPIHFPRLQNFFLFQVTNLVKAIQDICEQSKIGWIFCQIFGNCDRCMNFTSSFLCVLDSLENNLIYGSTSRIIHARDKQLCPAASPSRRRWLPGLEGHIWSLLLFRKSSIVLGCSPLYTEIP